MRPINHNLFESVLTNRKNNLINLPVFNVTKVKSTTDTLSTNNILKG
jgi:hypothetical protein